ncbi:MAG: type IV-A pilus assembly ATPase PilB [Francisellaceae bacterium]
MRFICDHGLIEDVDTESLIEKADRQQLPLISYLVASGFFKSLDMAFCFAEIFNLPFFDLTVCDVERIPRYFVDESLLKRYLALPLYEEGDRLYLAVSNPLEYLSIQMDYRLIFQIDIEIVMAEEDKLVVLMNDILQTVSPEALRGLERSTAEDLRLNALEQINWLDEEVLGGDDEPVVKFTNSIIIDAIDKGASDIHFEPYERSYRIRYRIDGILRQIAMPSTRLAQRVSSRLKIMSQLDIAEKRVPQDGRFKLKVDGDHLIDFRVNTCPTISGEKVALRILDQSIGCIGIDGLGLNERQRQLYVNALFQSQGMILVTGPTGSGKTVTLYTGLGLINTNDKNISTAEDPVEINLEGINQIQINNKQGLTFARALRAFLRQDPDIIMVGEIRDLETADIAIKAAQTGHLVLSTVHTNSATETLNRLIDMGVARYNIASSVILIIAQRLVRRLCRHCRIVAKEPIDDSFRRFGDEKSVIYHANPEGCGECFHGYKGRVGVYEVMPVSEKMSRLIISGKSVIELKEQAQHEGIYNLKQAVFEKVLAGVTSIEEAERVVRV